MLSIRAPRGGFSHLGGIEYLDGSDASTTDVPMTSDAPPPRDSAEAHAPQLRELGLWLHALRSFFNLSNHPLSETDRAELLNRDFAAETRIAQQTLRRCLRLLLSLQTEKIGSSSSQPASAPDRITMNVAQSGTETSAAVPLLEVLGDGHGLCEALLSAPHVSFHAWGSLGRLLARELEQADGANRLLNARAHTLFEQQPELFTLTERLAPDTLGADMHAIFARLTLLLDELRFVEETLRADVPLKQTLPLFTLAHEEARTLIELIERRAVRADELGASVQAALDSASYAMGMELCKVFAHELVGLSALRDPVVIFARFENAHGLLRDCFQQIIVALAQGFDPAFDGARLFQTFRTRLEQSLVLRRELWNLLEHVRRAERAVDGQPLAPLLVRLDAFQAGSMSYLMFKDWEAFERFVQELKDAADPTESMNVLHRFGTFLEALFSQINMRAGLAEHPFDYTTNSE